MTPCATLISETVSMIPVPRPLFTPRTAGPY
jgi:hypothetical protein